MSEADVILPTLPVMIPLMAGVALLLMYRLRRLETAVTVVALVGNLAVALLLLAHTYGGYGANGAAAGGVLVSQMGNWPAPFGITVALDTLSSALLSITAVVALAVFVFIKTQSPERVTGGYFHVLFLILLLGVNWAFIAGDLFNLFVSFEVMLMSSYVLMIIGTTVRQMRQAYKYVILNMVASTVFVAACGWIYGSLGTLNLAELTYLSRTGQITGGAALAAAALVFVFSLKGAVFPLWFWLPDTYPTLPTGVGALFAALLTKVGVYSLLRVIVMCFGQAEVVAVALRPALMVAAGLTMLLGALGMAGAPTLRRLLSNGVLVGVGYMLLGLAYALNSGASGPEAASATDGVVGTVFYMAQHMLIITGLLLCTDVVERYAGTDVLAHMGGLIRRDWLLAVAFFIAALSLVGLPPTSGTFGKYLLIRASFERSDGWGWVLGCTMIASSGLTLVAMMRVWCTAFWSRPAPGTPLSLPPISWPRVERYGAVVPLSLLVGLALAVGLFAQQFYDIASVAARGIIDPRPYLHAVLGPGAAGIDPASLPLLPEALDVPGPRPGGAGGAQ